MFTVSTIYNSQDMETTSMSINRWMDKDAVYLYSGLLLSYKKEQIWASSGEVDEPRAYYTDWSHKERNKYRVLTHIHEI